MEKFLSIMLALVMVLSMSTVAFAADNDDQGEVQPATSDNNEVEYSPSEVTSFTIKKTYESNVDVNEELEFTVTPTEKNPDSTTLTVGENNKVEINALSTDITVNVPSYTMAGVYTYKIQEKTGNTAGVAYTDSTITVQILVEYDNVDKKLVIGNPKDSEYGITSYILKTDGTKTDTFTNTFSSGSFTVAKDVIGNMANENDKFDINVTLISTKPVGTDITAAGTTVSPDAWETNYEEDGTTVKNYTYTKTLNISEASGKQTFTNIPVGVTVTVAEDIATEKMNGYYCVGNFLGDYTVAGTTVTGDHFDPLTVAADNTNTDITVVNSKTASVVTGIDLDSMPYVLMLAVACVGMFLFISKKRMMREN